MEDGGWRMEDGLQRADGGGRTTDHGPRTTEHRRPTNNGQGCAWIRSKLLFTNIFVTSVFFVVSGNGSG
jgi:hypothetical protein